jgi:hypothetical protein
MGVTLYACSFKSFVDIRADALTLHFEDSAGTNIFWDLLLVKQQYHSTYLQLRLLFILFLFILFLFGPALNLLFENVHLVCTLLYYVTMLKWNILPYLQQHFFYET